MNWPLGELKALATKAARGAGFSWSLAEEAAYACQWLDTHGVAGVAHLASYLQWVEKNGLLDAPTDMLGALPAVDSLKCPIALGCFVIDSELTLSDAGLLVRQPALLLPFLGQAATKHSIVCKFNGVAVEVCDAGIDQAALNLPELALDEATVTWQLKYDVRLRCISNSRVKSERAYIETLQRLAHKTYAPATEASRLSGAGAGTTDND